MTDGSKACELIAPLLRSGTVDAMNRYASQHTRVSQLSDSQSPML